MKCRSQAMIMEHANQVLQDIIFSQKKNYALLKASITWVKIMKKLNQFY